MYKGSWLAPHTVRLLGPKTQQHYWHRRKISGTSYTTLTLSISVNNLYEFWHIFIEFFADFKIFRELFQFFKNFSRILAVPIMCFPSNFKFAWCIWSLVSVARDPGVFYSCLTPCTKSLSNFPILR